MIRRMFILGIYEFIPSLHNRTLLACCFRVAVACDPERCYCDVWPVELLRCFLPGRGRLRSGLRQQSGELEVRAYWHPPLILQPMMSDVTHPRIHTRRRHTTASTRVSLKTFSTFTRVKRNNEEDARLCWPRSRCHRRCLYHVVLGP